MPVTTFLIAALVTAGMGHGASSPPPDPAILDRAETAFRAGIAARDHPDQARQHFRAAREHYATLRRQGILNPGLCRNEGSAALLADDLPVAIAAYRRGLRLDPSDRGLRENLEYARDQVAYPAGLGCRPAASGWPPWLPRPANELLLGMALALYAVGCIIVTRWLIGRRGSGGVVVLVLAGGLGMWWGARQVRADAERRHPLVVVVADTLPLHTGNGRAYLTHPRLPAVRRGMEGRLVFVRGDWLQVEFPGGEVGWLPRGDVLVDEP
jgi:hypothetical protein